jgi:hypothetical protein
MIWAFSQIIMDFLYLILLIFQKNNYGSRFGGLTLFFQLAFGSFLMLRIRSFLILYLSHLMLKISEDLVLFGYREGEMKRFALKVFLETLIFLVFYLYFY